MRKSQGNGIAVALMMNKRWEWYYEEILHGLYMLLCAALLCSACAKKKENESEKYWRDYAIVRAMFGLPAESETEWEVVLRGSVRGMILRENVLAAINREEEAESDSGIWQGTAAEDEYKTGSLLQEEEWLVIPEEVTWSKHAFLLEDEDVFFSSMPDNWKSVCRQYNGLVSIYFPTEGMLSKDQREEFCRLSVVKCQNTLKTLEDFTFADGQVGKKNGLKVYSADGKYGFVVESGTTNVQCREYMKCSEEFYESMIFQNAQIGLSQTESLKKPG